MGSSAALFCCTAVVLALLSSASERDEHNLEQREVTFDKIMQEMEQQHPMLQREITFAELFPNGFPDDSLVVSPPERFERINDKGRLRFGPRSFGGPPILDYEVQFPLGRPTSDNLRAICVNGDRRPSYPESYFPASGFGQQKRKASAVNKAESWFSTCCQGNQTWGTELTLCCATQAWELYIQSFCEEASSIKDRLYHCCKLSGNDELACFQNDAPNPNYEATEELPVPPLPSTGVFPFDPSTCLRTEMTLQSVQGQTRATEMKASAAPQKVDMSFPPGRPTSDTIEALCRNQKRRPLYKTNCPMGARHEHLARQAKTINRIETGFKHCCKRKQAALDCADQKWREELDKYCVDKDGGRVDFRCCLSDVSDDRYNCFQEVSPDRHYNMTSAPEELSLHKICDIPKILSKKLPAGFPLTSFVNQCCHLSEENKSACIQQKLAKVSEMCSSRRTSHQAVRRCCSTSSPESVQCFSKILMDAISKATNVSRQKKRKRCPLKRF
nr:extracellular matrix protein 1-like isoform X1 [Gasterosteus aculeatus aculeatus]